MRLHRSLLLGLAVAAAAAMTSPLAAATKAKSAPRPPAEGKTAAPARHGVLPFIDDDYPRALSAARVSKKPIFIEAWAPW